MHLNRHRICTFIFVLSSCVSYGSGQELPPAATRDISYIEPMAIYEYCKTLTSPEFTGRLSGTKGYFSASRWIGQQLSGWKIEPFTAEGAGYFQSFPIPITRINFAQMTLMLPPTADSASRNVTLTPGSDYLPLLYTGAANVTADIVFAGWGISAPELGYDDYSGLDVQGKFVLCFRGTPDSTDDRFTIHDEHRTRMALARKLGALGVFYIMNAPLANPNGDYIPEFAPAIVTEKIADLINRDKELESSFLRSMLLKTKKPYSFATGTRVHYTVHASHSDEGRGYNVIGIIEGSDPVLKNEYVVLGAHADHCGQLGDLLFPGADDNASGTAVVMEIGRAFASLREKPKRSIAIVLFDGEETGLQGSTYFVDHMSERFPKVAAMLNFDMVGEGDGASCEYSTSTMKQNLIEADSPVGILRDTSRIVHLGVRAGDYAPFFQKGIPCIAFFSNGPHVGYHWTSDNYYRLNPDIMGDIAKLGLGTALRIANDTGEKATEKAGKEKGKRQK